MFILNLGFRWSLRSASDLSGVVLLPAHNAEPRVARGAPRDHRTFLLDPQVYLAGLGVKGRTKTCARLATYPWFMVEGLDSYDSSADETRPQWEARLRIRLSESGLPRLLPTSPEQLTCVLSIR